MIGPGKYDTECTVARLTTGALGTILLVFEGHKGTGFSAQLPAHMLPAMATLLREIADQIEADQEKGVS